MQGVRNFKNNKQVKVYCPNGFANQLRLTLAGSFLVSNNYIESYSQEWVLNNHNNVELLNYFHPIPGVLFEKVDKENSINSTTFEMMINTYTKRTVCPSDALQEVKTQLRAKEWFLKEIDLFSQDKIWSDCAGIHARKTCKLSFLNLEETKYRTENKIDSNEDILNKIKDFKSVYLATDNKQTQSWFKEKLNSRLIVYKDIITGNEFPTEQYTRDDVIRYTDPEHTVADFLILLKVGCFSGTNQSSFSGLIKNIRNSFMDFSLYGKV